MKKILIMAVLAGCCGAAQAQDARTLDCKAPASIRAFKDAVMERLIGVAEPGRKNAADWSAMLCGEAAEKAGFNSPGPKAPAAVPGMPGWGRGVPQEAYAARLAKEYFGPNLPLTAEQAMELARKFTAAWAAEEKAAKKKTAKAAPAKTPVKKSKKN